ncbi:SWIM zinc finger domain-containing protein [Brachyspira hyodysenteriae]|uniref:SWIM zinc finger family protein n=1 Tax=Brachyspira hyodysenteriae TaxID=159 RepID=UPI0022CDA297|nr:SWIM zinc finger family protein [Brachyspira hyodysenteriae]MCZ9851297.1 SWIM zinc finger domain-containing protein [Brachyspira hyodysenteriae]MCZ9859977.1 SWIM zinc finger domain-containing protein [Brachyspira hyodysenteriae]MCZ9870486.1 SWIM zinc finger domain-containing protein [Brachyspira hyodysenteriae]MCZ9874634.1 SWIM zinc finger domain-containing protein [Brachyspira hyodysenteriae]MCZ9878783.1 SWIM zinc finger domain-containing protein [Brachyspira hyodysenteriae]
MTEKINNLKQYINENFLLTLTNKGIYNRSVKDIDNIINNSPEKIHIEEAEDKIKVTIDTGEKIEVILNDEDLKSSKCSCPSKDICKHIIMSLLYIEHLDTENKENESNTDTAENNTEIEIKEENNTFDEVKNISYDEIKKLSTKKNFEYALDRLDDNIEADIEEKAMLEINIPEENVIIYFPKKDSIKKAVCSCKDSSLCAHKIIAILKYKQMYNSLEEIKEDDKEIDENILKFSKEFIENIFEKGLYSCSEKDFDIAEQLSVKLQVKEMPELAKMFRSISESIDSMINKHASFNKLFTFAILSRLYNTIKVIEKAKQDNDNKTVKLLTGEIRSKYINRKSAELVGLGSYPWISSTGYLGASAYLYNLNTKKLSFFSYVIPTFYDNSKISYDDVRSNYRKKIHFENNISIEEISKYKLKFINYKVNNEERISSSKFTSVILNDRMDYKLLEEIKNSKNNEELFAENYDDIKNIDFKYDYFNKNDRSKIIIAKFQIIENQEFNKIEQTLYFDIVNNYEEDDEERLTLNVKYTSIHSNGIKYIMNYKNSNIDKDRFIVLEKTKYYIRPISIINANAVINIFFDN